jgi:hypothetical protein
MLVTGSRTDHRDVPVEPDEALGGCVLLLLQLVKDEVLKGLGQCGSSELAVADFLGHVSYSPAIQSPERCVP